MRSAWQQFPAVAALAAAIPLGTLLHQPSPSRVIPYKETSSGSLKLYCFEPADARPDQSLPAVLWIHGGGWTGGNCQTFFPLARYTARRGAVSFVVEYRLVKPGETSVSDCVADCKSAMRYIRSHARELGVDSHRIAAIGESAGGHLAACLATLPDCNAPTDNLKISACPDALVLYYPLTDFTQSGFSKLIDHGLSAAAAEKRERDLSPLFHVRPGLPPTLIVHGLADTVISPEQSRRFAQAMNRAGDHCRLTLLPDLPHAFLVPEYKCSEAVVVRAMRLGDEFLTSLGYFSGNPTLTASEPPAWKAKWPPAAQPSTTKHHS